MSREIKFRGFSEELNTWIYGCYRAGTDSNTSYIFPHKEHHENFAPVFHAVESESVGQYSGERDCCSYRIWEGDIVESSQGKRYEIVFKHGAFCLKDGKRFMPLTINHMTHTHNIRVIGNKYEVLEGKQ